MHEALGLILSITKGKRDKINLPLECANVTVSPKFTTDREASQEIEVPLVRVDGIKLMQ